MGVSNRGYYHARPKTEEAPTPQKIESPESLEWKKVSFSSTRKRIPALQKREKVEEPTKPTQEQPLPNSASPAAAPVAPVVAPAPAPAATPAAGPTTAQGREVSR